MDGRRIFLTKGLEDLIVIPGFLPKSERLELVERLHAIDYESSYVLWNGRRVRNKRQVKWYGPCRYAYSDTQLFPSTDSLGRHLQQALFQSLGANSVLVNRYPDKSAAISWHSDDEEIFDHNAPISSLSFGSPRRFLLRRKGRTGSDVSVLLEDNTLVIMPPRCQQLMQHCVQPGEVQGVRINLTFRCVKPEYLGDRHWGL